MRGNGKHDICMLYREPKGEYKMDYPQKLTTLGTQDTERRQAKQNTHHYRLTNTNKVNKT